MLRLENIHKSFPMGNRSLHVLRGIDLGVESGELVSIMGASGSGKSGLALQAMALGASLVADDQTILTRRGDGIVATCPAQLQGRIEARGVGLLQAEARDSALLQLVVDMDLIETDRLPPQRRCRILGISLPLLHKTESPYFTAAVTQYLKGGRSD